MMPEPARNGVFPVRAGSSVYAPPGRIERPEAILCLKYGRSIDSTKRNPYSPPRNRMTEPAATSSRRGARTFRAACLVLATVAAAQAAATAWSSKPGEVEIAKSVVPERPPEAPKPKIIDPFSQDFTPDDPHPEMSAPAGDPPSDDPGMALMRPEPVISIPKTPAPLDVAITDPEVLTQLDEALHLRSQGDMQGALSRLRVALRKMPDHPKLLYHTGQTLDMMGLHQKADPYWKSLHRLGKGAGDFFALARERMADGPQVIAEPEEEKEGRFTVTDLRDEKVTDISRGERVRFTAVLKKNGNEAIELEKLRDDMVLAIHFFDTVNGRRIARSQVPQPELSCVSEPLDWAEGSETFAFEYWQPDMSPEQILKYGRCRYYGCTLEVLYQNKLQDHTATTPELLQLARELPLPAPEPEESILDSGPVPLPGSQPESGLFPPALKP